MQENDIIITCSMDFLYVFISIIDDVSYDYSLMTKVNEAKEVT